jgi:hypothetical protein
MNLPLDDNRGRLSYCLFYAQRCVVLLSDMVDNSDPPFERE